jgi:hypothetical protein
MKQVAVLLLITLALSSCSTPTVSQQAQTAAGGTWSAEMLGGSGKASGFSFITEFTLSTDGILTLSYFQFLTTNSCFPVDGGTQAGQMSLNVNESTDQVTGTFKYTVTSSGNTLTLNGNVTGTEVNGVPPLSGGSITGTWNLTGGTGCNDSSGTFTMTQSASTTTSSSSST